MGKLLQEKKVKGKSTDKKIAQIIVDLYTKNTFYDKIYQMVEIFMNTGDDISAKSSSISIEDIDINSDKPFENIDFLNIFVKSIKFDMGEILLLGAFFNKAIKSIDLEIKYSITNVTLKERLPLFFDRVDIKEKRKFLGRKPKFNVLIWVAFYFYFKNKDIKQDNIMLNLLNLFENNL